MVRPGVPLAAGTYDPAERVLNTRAGPVSLTPIEARLLDYFLAHAGQTLTHGELMREVWGYREGAQSRTLYTTVERLRKKIELDPASPRHLHNRARQGYCFELSPPGSADLVGREALLGELLDLLVPGALITLIGAGGAGKTRLAEESCETLRARGWRASLCPLADARTEEEVVRRVAEHLGVRLSEDDPVEQLGRALESAGRALLALDNLEQLSGALGPLVRWRAQAPQLTLLATSRASLGLPGERTLSVAPLFTPRPDDDETGILRTPAVRLLLQRTRPRPGLDPGSLARIARAVDGLPLALELAAARLRLLSASALAERLEQDLGALRDPTRPERHETLEALVAWSWGLLSPAEREVLGQVGVFAAPFDTELAEAVLRPPPGIDLLGVLEALVEHHLLRALPTDPPRLAPFEPVRGFLRGLGAPDPALLCRYARACAARGPQDGESLLNVPGGPERWRRLSADLPHMLFVAREARTHCAEDAARAALHAWEVLLHSGPVSAGPPLLRGALEAASLPPALRNEVSLALAQALHLSGGNEEALLVLSGLEAASARDRARARHLQGQVAWRARRMREAEDFLLGALDGARELGDAALLTDVRLDLAALYLNFGRDEECAAQLDEILLRLSPEGDRLVRVRHGFLQGRLHIHLRQTPQAIEAMETAIRGAMGMGLGHLASGALEGLAYLRWSAGDAQGAREALHQALREADTQGQRRWSWILHRALGWIELEAGELNAAHEHLRLAIAGPREHGEVAREVLGLWRMAELERRRGDLRTASRWLDRAEAIWPEEAFPVERARAALVRGQLLLAQEDRAGAERARALAQATLTRRPPGWDPELEAELTSLERALRCEPSVNPGSTDIT